MKTLNLIVLLMLAFCSVGFSAEKKSPVILLQEGIYAEETEGDLKKAINLYEQVLEQYKDVERLAARATYQLGMCYLKKGEKDKAAEYFGEVVSYYPEQTVVAKKAKAQLDKIGVSPVAKQGNVFDILGPEICSFIGSKYGEICAEAGTKKMYSSSRIYVVDSSFYLHEGGMGYVYNWTGQPITDPYKISNTSYPDQKLYSVGGEPMDVNIVPDKQHQGMYEIIWNPKEPLQPGQFFNYGWATSGSTKLQTTGPRGGYSLTMQNHLNANAYETFFLAIPQGMILSDLSNDYTGSASNDGWDIYWWKKIVQQDENHVEKVQLEKNNKIILKDSFEKGTDAPEGWLRGNKIDGVEYIWDKNIASDGTSSLCLKKTVKKYFPIAQWTKKVKHQANSKKISVSAKVKAQNTTKAILDTLFLDKDGKWIKHEWLSYIGENKEKNIPPANHDWKIYSGSVEVPENTETIIIGLQIYGPGTVWFDDLEVAYVRDSEITSGKQNKLQAEDLIAEGWKLWGERKLAEAEDKFKEAISKNPEAEGAYQGLGWAQLNQGKKLNAKESFEKCIELNPKNSAALNGLGWIAHGKGNIDQAIEWWEKAVKASNGTATASLSGLTQVYMERKEYDKAEKYYQIWIKAEPNNKEAKEGLEKAKELSNN